MTSWRLCWSEEYFKISLECLFWKVSWFTFPSSTKSADISLGLFLFPLRVALKLDNVSKWFEIVYVCWPAYPHICICPLFQKEILVGWDPSIFICLDVFDIGCWFTASLFSKGIPYLRLCWLPRTKVVLGSFCKSLLINWTELSSTKVSLSLFSNFLQFLQSTSGSMQLGWCKNYDLLS